MTGIYLVAAVLFGIAGYRQMEKKNREPWLGAVLGFLLGLIGLIIVLCLSEQKNPVAQGPVGPYAPPPSGPTFTSPQAGPPVAQASAQPYVAPSGQRYVAPIVPQYAAPQPPAPQAVQPQMPPPSTQPS